MATESLADAPARLVNVAEYVLADLRSTEDPMIVAATDELVSRVVGTAQTEPQEQRPTFGTSCVMDAAFAISRDDQP